jgi:hypothetical protein
MACIGIIAPSYGEDHRPPAAAIAGHPVHRPESSARSTSGSGGAWWMGPSGVVLVLAAVGGASWAARRYKLLPVREAGWLQVVARVPLSPRQSVYAVRAGDRVLILGTGAGGPPSLLADCPGSDFPDLAPSRPTIPRPGGAG